MAVVAELRIRPMTDADLERVVEVWERSRRDAQPWLDERMAYTHEDSLRHFREVIAREYQVWVAQEDGDAPVALLAVADSVVGYLYVDPTAQGRGVGSALLARAKRLFPMGLSLDTHQRNARARAFYLRRGFRPVGFGVSPAPESEPDVRYAWSP